MASPQSPPKTNRPWRFSPRQYWTVLKTVYRRFSQDQLQLMAAGVAFYFLLALVPMLSALISIYGLLTGTYQVTEHLRVLEGLVPDDIIATLGQHMNDITQTSDTALSTGAVFSITLAIWSASKGIQALIKACNHVYQETNQRKWWLQLILRFVSTFCALLIITAAITVIGLIPFTMQVLNIPASQAWIANLLVWPLFALFFACSILMLFRFAPQRRAAKWVWITPGALIATLLWMITSASFSFYVANFASYEQTYGSLAGVIVLLMWFYLSTLIILLGGEINSALEHHTQKDTTKGEEQPRGKRGAIVADTYPDSFSDN